MSGLKVYNYISALNKYNHNGIKYFNMQDLMKNKDYTKGCNASQIKLMERKKFSNGSVIQGRIGIDDISIFEDTVISKKHTKRFVKCDAVMEEFKYIWDANMQNNDNNEQIGRWNIFDAKPLVKPMDNDFYMFKDKDGKQYNVEMRGERSRDKILFNCKEVGEMFEMNRLDNDILKTHTSYNEIEDFVFCKNKDNILKNTDKTLYLTYSGLKKVINNSRSGRAKEFANWLDDIVFAVIAGDDEQRMQASANVMNISIQALIDIFNKNTSAISCVYLLKTNYNSDDKCVYKYGFSKDLARRFKEHTKTFGDELELTCYTFISEDNLSTAEKELKDAISCFGYKSDKELLKSQEELLLLGANEIKNVKSIIQTIGNKFGSDNKNLIDSFNKLIMLKDTEIRELKHEMTLKDKNIEMRDKQIEDERTIHKLELESKDKDLEILNLKLLLSQKNN